MNMFVYRVLQGNDRLRAIESDGLWGVAQVCHDVTGSWEAGSVRHAHYLPLDSRTKNSAQNLHRHPWLEGTWRRLDTLDLSFLSGDSSQK